MSFPLLSVAVANSVMFGTYSNVLQYLCDTHHRDHSVNPPRYAHIFTAGCVSGMVQVRASLSAQPGQCGLGASFLDWV